MKKSRLIITTRSEVERHHAACPDSCRRRRAHVLRGSQLSRCFSMASRPLHHPSIETVTVADILHALADPVRLAIVSELRDAESEMNCVETMSKVEVVLPKSTCSQHFQILREAGLIRCERQRSRAVEPPPSARARGTFPGPLDRHPQGLPRRATEVATSRVKTQLAVTARTLSLRGFRFDRYGQRPRFAVPAG